MTRFADAIKHVDKTMRTLGIKYAFISGTALGLGRAGACMAYDVDVDFCIHTRERPRLDEIKQALGLNVLSEMRASNGRLEGIGFDLGGGDGLEWVELDFLHTRGDKVWYSACLAGDITITKVYPNRMWDNLQYIEAYGVKCPVLNPIEEYLEMLYGEDWRTPNQFYFNQEMCRKTKARHYDFDLTED
jgi:phosphorylcholine metabolism protein LicD